MLISDTRRLRVYRVRSVRGELEALQGADVWQDTEGKVMVSGLWEGLLVPSQEDLQICAGAAMVSPLEQLRQQLLSCASVVVEVVGYAK